MLSFSRLYYHSLLKNIQSIPANYHILTQALGAKRVLSIRHVLKREGNKHEGPITNTRRPASMNYDGAEGLEFGGGSTKVDPSVAAGQL
jgi:hypothetical protein